MTLLYIDNFIVFLIIETQYQVNNVVEKVREEIAEVITSIEFSNNSISRPVKALDKENLYIFSIVPCGSYEIPINIM